MAHSINCDLIEPRADIAELARVGPIGAELVARDHEGKSLIEFVLPNRFAEGPHVPFEASWWLVDPGEVTPADRHAVQELWLVARGQGEMSLGERSFEIASGQAIYIPPDTSHLLRATGTEAFGAFSVWW